MRPLGRKRHIHLPLSAMKIILITISLLLFGNHSLSQGYGVGIEFYPNPIRETKLLDQSFWNKKVKKLSRKHSRSPNNAELIYKLAIAKSYVLTNDLTDIIVLLDKAINLDSTQAKYYAVRGIVKYDWGAYSPDYDISEGCPDIKKALEFGLIEKLKRNEAINGILNHPSCN